MKIFCSGVGLLLLSAFTYGGAFQAAGAQKEIRQSPIYVDGVETPSSLDELWDKSALVIEGQVIDVRSANQTFTPKVVMPAGGPEKAVTRALTDFVVKVNQVLKSDGGTKEGGTVIVRRAGGMIDRGTHISEHVEPGFSKFNKNSRYILFLEKTTIGPSPEPVYFPVAGADSAFELRGAQVLPLGKSETSRELAKLGALQLAASLQKRGRR